MNGFKHYVDLCDWCFVHLRIIFSKFIHVVAWITTSCLYIAREYCVVWMYHTLHISSSIDGHLTHFYFWAIINNSLLNTHVQVFA